jgi:crotonobetainyl-CoA:carnitine CoA-transferase CaiB-like acyl-CoA transferase
MHNVVPRMSRTPGGFFKQAPDIGQHNQELLGPLLAREEYERLVAEGVITTGLEHRPEPVKENPNAPSR